MSYFRFKSDTGCVGNTDQGRGVEVGAVRGSWVEIQVTGDEKELVWFERGRCPGNVTGEGDGSSEKRVCTVTNPGNKGWKQTCSPESE